MKSIILYAAIFGIPMVLYGVWLARFTRQLAFPLLLILAVVIVWGSLWPLHFGAEHWRVTGEMIGDQADAVVNGFVLMGWIYGVIGCLPVLLVEIPRSIVLLIRKREAKRDSSILEYHPISSPDRRPRQDLRDPRTDAPK